MNRWILSYAIAIAIAGIAVHTHHSIAAVYDTSRQVAIEGVVTAFHFVNPHPFLMMHVKDASGQTQQWRLEIDNRSELAEIGVTRETWKPGDWIVVTGSPGRTQRHSLYVRRLDRPADGFWYRAGRQQPQDSCPAAVTVPATVRSLPQRAYVSGGLVLPFRAASRKRRPRSGRRRVRTS